MEAVSFQAGLVAAAAAPTEFRLLNSAEPLIVGRRASLFSLIFQADVADVSSSFLKICLF